MKQHYATLTFIGKKKNWLRTFRNTHIKIAYKTSNTLQKFLTPTHNKKDKFHNSGVYRLTCPDCGKTGRNFKKRYKEHLLPYKHGNYNS